MTYIYVVSCGLKLSLNMNLLKNNQCLFKLVQSMNYYTSSKPPHPIKYYKFKYSPRYEGQVDPPCEPSKLFMVKKIRQLKGLPKWEKKMMQELKLDGPMQQVTIVKNSPETNSRLWQVKHLIQITPIVFPNGEPTAEDVKSLGATFLNPYGEMTVVKQLKPIEPVLQLVTQVPEESIPTKDTVRRQLRMKWLNGF